MCRCREAQGCARAASRRARHSGILPSSEAKQFFLLKIKHLEIAASLALL
jgi:hypothetical protein